MSKVKNKKPRIKRMTPKQLMKALKTTECGYCKTLIVEKDEPKKKFFIHKGKPMCGVCRAVKLSSVGDTIIADVKRKSKRDMQNAIKKAQKQEEERILSIAAQSPETLKDLTNK